MDIFYIESLKTELYNNNIDDKKYNQIFNILSQLTYAPPINYKKFINIISCLNDNHNIYIFQVDNKIVGMITLLIESKLIYNGKKVGHIEDLVIDKKYRSKGIATKLIEYVLDISKKNNCYKVILNCNASSDIENLIRFYNKNGFNRAGIFMRYNIE